MNLPPGNVSLAEEVTVGEFGALAEEEMSRDELDRIKNLLLTEIAIGNEVPAEQAAYRGYWTIVGGADFIQNYFDRIESATPADLKRTAAKYFAAERHLATTLMPR